MTIKVTKPAINLREKLNELNSSEADKAIKDGVLTVKSAKVYGEVESDTLNVKGNVTFTDDTGLTDKVIWDSGTEELTIGGNVGIGTTSPISPLHIENGAQSLSHTFIYGDRGISVEADEPMIQLMAGDSGTHGGSLLWRYGNNVFAAVANPTTDNLDFISGVTTDNSFSIHSGTNMSGWRRTMSIGADGKVGIGTTIPAGRMHVYSGDAGTVTPSTQADDLVIENSAEGGITIMTPDNQSARIRFTSPATESGDLGGAHIFYRQNINKMTIGTTVSGGKLSLLSGAGAETLVLDSSGNVGLGVTPESWTSNYTVLQIGAQGVIANYSDGRTTIGDNWYDNAGYMRINEDYASRHLQHNGQHYFDVAPSGDADSAITWKTALTIDNGGDTIFYNTSNSEKMRWDASESRLAIGSLKYWLPALALAVKTPPVVSS